MGIAKGILGISTTALCWAVLGCGGGAALQPDAGGAGSGGGVAGTTGMAGDVTGGGAGTGGIAGTGGPILGAPCGEPIGSVLRRANEPVAAGTVALSAPSMYQTMTASASMDVGDVDGDGALDLVVSPRPVLSGEPASSLPAAQAPMLLLNDGTGSFRASPLPFVVPGPGAVHLADVTGDARHDLLTFTGGQGGASLSVLANEGGGRFAAPRSFAAGDGTPWVWAALPPNPMATGDLDGDGQTDVAVLGKDAAYVLLNQGGGAFAAPVAFSTAPGYPTALAIADLDGDGRGELAVTTYAIAPMGPLLEQSLFLLAVTDGAKLGVKAKLPIGLEPVSIAIADLDRDGDRDLVLGSSSGPGVYVLLNRGAGTFADRVGYPIKSQSCAATEALIADFDGDGVLDVAATHGTFGTVNVLLGKGDGTFGAEQWSLQADDIRRIVATDLNRDGRADVVVQGYFANGQTADEISVYLSRTR
jgi:hypothetical protein